MRILMMALVLVLGTLTARAEPDVRRLVDDPVAETRFGTITLVEAYTPAGKGFYRSFLSVDGRLLHGLYPHAMPERVFDWGEKGDVVLIEQLSGCCSDWFLLPLSEDDLRLIGPFARHGKSPSEFHVSDDELSFRMERTFPASIDHWRVRYDGQAPSIEVIYETEDGFLPAGSGEDVTRWVGTGPAIIFIDPTERLRFFRKMNREQLDRLRTSLVVADREGAQIRDGFLVSSGCWPRSCGEKSGFIAIEVATGAPFAALLWCDELGLFTGDRAAPAPMLELIAEERARSAVNHRSSGSRPLVRPCEPQ